MSPRNDKTLAPATKFKPKLFIIVTLPYCFETFLRGQPGILAEHFDVTLVTSPSASLEEIERREGVRVIGIMFTRAITPKQDLHSLVALVRLLRSERPDLVQTYTPKAGLLGMIAAKVARTPVRIHGIIGMPMMEARGFRRIVLSLSERLTYACSSGLTCVSAGLKDWIRKHLSRRQVDVIGHGSIHGVDLREFAPASDSVRAAGRTRYGYSQDDVVIMFAGRLVADKGVKELLSAFVDLRLVHERAQLMLVGDYDKDDWWSTEIGKQITALPGLTRVPFTKAIAELMQLADVFVLPSYREGMPNVVLEAAAVGLPQVVTDINGSNEIVVEGVNGLLVSPKDSEALTQALLTLVESPDRLAMGAAGRRYVEERFDQRRFCDQLIDYYTEAHSVARSENRLTRRTS